MRTAWFHKAIACRHCGEIFSFSIEGRAEGSLFEITRFYRKQMTLWEMDINEHVFMHKMQEVDNG